MTIGRSNSSARRATRRRQRKIVLGMIEVSGYWSRMHAGLELIGEDVTLLCIDEHPYAYSGQPRSLLMRLLRRARSGTRSNMNRIIEVVLRALLLARYALTHDTFVFGYRTSFFNTRDLWLLKLLGKTVVMVFHGSDERPPYMDGYLGSVPDDELIARTRDQKKRVDRCHSYADIIVSNPSSGQFQSGRCLTYHVLGNPVSTTAKPTRARPGTAAQRTINIVHAPSSPDAKGSALIRRVCRELKASGLDIELQEVIDVSNAELHRRILDADFVIDQAYGDCPWAMLAAEASLLGRPVVIGGYGYDANGLDRYLPEGLVPPAARCEPDDLAGTIRWLAMDEQARLALGQQAQDFASTRWSPVAVAQRLLMAIDGNAPDNWYFEAETVD